MATTYQKTPEQDRKIGMELEFSGPQLETVANLIHEHFGGNIDRETSYVSHIKKARWGDFRIECDSTFLKNRVYSNWLKKIGIDLEDQEIEKLDQKIAHHSDVLVPKELVTPPIPRSDLSDFYEFVDAFRDLHIENEDYDFSLAPLGLHLNFEVASLETSYLLSILKSFCLNYKKLVKEIKVDFKRSMAPYIAPFPDDYIQLICKSDYNPEQTQFIQDYFKFNPTRNRALDMTTIFAHLDWSLLEKVEGLEIDLINARPAFHYRLPNCHLRNPEWSIEKEVQRWDLIEDFAQKLPNLETSEQIELCSEAVS